MGPKPTLPLTRTGTAQGYNKPTPPPQIGIHLTKVWRPTTVHTPNQHRRIPGYVPNMTATGPLHRHNRIHGNSRQSNVPTGIAPHRLNMGLAHINRKPIGPDRDLARLNPTKPRSRPVTCGQKPQTSKKKNNHVTSHKKPSQSMVKKV